MPFPQHREFRSRMRSLRREVGSKEAREAASAVKNILLAEPSVRNAANIAVYAATDGEVDLSDVASWAQQAGKRVFYPAMREYEIAETTTAEDEPAETTLETNAETDAETNAKANPDKALSAQTRFRIAFVEWLPDADWTTGAFGIPEPEGGKEIAIEECDAALVPGVAFGIDGRRIGRGKGYYDQALAFLAEGSRPRPPVLFGICHDFQIHDFQTAEGSEQSPFAAKDHDIPVDAVVSPSGIHRRK